MGCTIKEKIDLITRNITGHKETLHNDKGALLRLYDNPKCVYVITEHLNTWSENRQTSNREDKSPVVTGDFYSLSVVLLRKEKKRLHINEKYQAV